MRAVRTDAGGRTMAGELNEKTALVTGAASGIGAAIARRFAAAGARVLVADINSDGAAAIAAEIGQGARPFTVDVRDEEQQQRMVAVAVELGNGTLDIAVNNAGYGAFA